MTDDQLRARLRRADPAADGGLVDPVTSPRAQELLERTVQTDPQTDPQTLPSASASRSRPDGRPAPARRLALLGAAATTVLLAGGAVLLGGDDGSAPAPDAGGGAPASGADGALALTVQPFDPLTGICPVFDPAQLSAFPVAFAGTATAVEGGTVTLDVTRWYRGGDAGTVTLQGPADPALIGFEVREGEEYLITAQDGSVTNCGASGIATPELQQAYEDAF